MNVKTYAFTCLLAIASTAIWAQQPPPGDAGGPGLQRRGAPDLMAENFFPPEMIMQNQKALNLTADQQTAFRAEMQKTMARFTDLQWQQSAESEALDELLKQERVDEKQALAQLDKLLTIENDVKRLHFGMMVRIKNLLTPEQQTKLRELKKQGRPIPMPHDRNPGGPGEGVQGERPRPQPPE
jgi:Spy/CpxP family protein refolding chaperone